MGDEPTVNIKRIGDYQVLEIIGQGGMGVVYRATDTTIGRTVAIKMLKGAYAEDPDLLKRFYREARSTGSLQHKNIVTVYSLGDQDGHPYLVIEYLDGESIAQIISSRKPMDLVEKLDLVIQVCDGLQYAHQRELVHRDIKPANILVTKEGVAKIVDFGIARARGGEGLTQTGQLIGSMFYMSPEQINGLAIDGRSDIFSTGVMLYEFLTYNLPFKAQDATTTFMKILREPPPPLSTYLSDYPKELDEILLRALEKQVDDRYQSAEEFGFDLIQVQDKLKRGMTSQFLQGAEAALKRGDVERARVHLQEILKLDRQNTQANDLLRQVRQTVQRQQRAAQVAQLRSQAQVALSSAQFEEALACAEQALRLNPEDLDSIQLRDHIKSTIAQVQSIRDSLSRAESALYAGDLDEANAAVQQALHLNPEHTEAKALNAVVERELGERARRQKVQSFVERARQDISERNFSGAIACLHEAETLDPSDSNIRELLHWASKGQEQELRRKELQDVTSRIDEAMRQQDFASASNMCDMALRRFPEDPSLLKLKSLAERQAELLERRRFVQDQSLAARRLADEGRHEEIVKLITAALQRYPGEPNLETLLALSVSELERTKRQREEDTRLEQEHAKDSWRASRQQLLDLCGHIRLQLDQRKGVESIAADADRLSTALATTATDDDLRSLALPLLLEFETRRNNRDQALRELEQIREASSSTAPADTAMRGTSRDRAQAILDQFPNDDKISALFQRVVAAIDHWRQERERALRELTTISESLRESTPSQAKLSLERAKEIAQSYAMDPQFGALVQQIQHETDRRVQSAGKVLQDLNQLRESTPRARTMAELSQILQRARSLASAEVADHHVSDALLQLQEVANQRREFLQKVLQRAQKLAQQATSAATIEDAEKIIGSLKDLADQNSDNGDVQSVLTRLTAQIRGRRVEHDLIVQELKALSSSISLGMSDEELLATEQRIQECSQKHPHDPEIQALCHEAESTIENNRSQAVAQEEEGVNPSATMIGAPPTAPKPKTPATAPPPKKATPKQAPAVAPPVQRPVETTTSRKPLLIATAALATVVVGGGAWWVLKPAATVEVGAQTDPAGATVHIGDKSCVSPCSVQLKPGSYTLSAELDGYDKVERTVQIRENTTESISLSKNEPPPTPSTAAASTNPPPAAVVPSTASEQPPQLAHLEIRGVPASAAIYVDGAAKGHASRKGDFAAEVTPGEHQVKVVSGSKELPIITRTFRPGAATALNADAFAPATAPQPAEQSDWQNVKDSRNLADVDRFLQRYPNGTYQAQARSRLEDLHWEAARNGGSAASVRNYLNLYPNGRYSGPATAELARLDWQQLQSSKDTSKLEDFLRRYPSGEYHDKANVQLDDLVWEHTKSNDVDSLRTYLQRFPNGRHSDVAHKAIDQSNRAKEAANVTVANAHPVQPPATSGPVASTTIDDRTAIQNALNEFERAYEAQDVAKLQRVWTGMSSEQVKSTASFFKTSNGVKLTNSMLSDPDIKGNQATVKCSQDLTFNDGKSTRHLNAKVTMKLKKVAQGPQPVWQIDTIR